jgi:hypothetical protein
MNFQTDPKDEYGFKRSLDELLITQAQSALLFKEIERVINDHELYLKRLAIIIDRMMTRLDKLESASKMEVF